MSDYTPPATPRKLHRIERRSLGTPPLEALLAAIPDAALERLWDLQLLLGERRAWPAWAIDVLAERQVDDDTRLEFVRVLERAWPSARFEIRAALARIARRFHVALPEERRESRPVASAPMRRLRPSPVASTGTDEVAALMPAHARCASNEGEQ